MLMGCMFTSLKICNLKFCVEGTYCTFSPVWGSNHRSQNSQRMTNTHQSFHNFSSSARIPGVTLGLGLGGDKRGTRVPNLEAQTQRVTSTLCSPSPKCELLLKFGPWRSHLLHPSPRTPCWKLPHFFFLNSEQSGTEPLFNYKLYNDFAIANCICMMDSISVFIISWEITSKTLVGMRDLEGF